MPVNVGNSKITVNILDQDDFTLGVYDLDWEDPDSVEKEIRTLIMLNVTEGLCTFTISFREGPDIVVPIPGLMQATKSFLGEITSITTDCTLFYVDMQLGVN